MPGIPLQHRRGTTANHIGFTGLAGEFTMDTTKNTVVVHDGLTAGGIPLAKESHTHPAAKYQVIMRAATPATPRTNINFSNEFTASDDAANDKTDIALTVTGVTAGTYGSGANVPQIAVNSKGQITSVANQAISFPAPVPTQTANGGKFLKTNGSNTLWDYPVRLATYSTFPTPGPDNDGLVVLPDGGLAIGRSNSSSYDYFGPIHRVFKPVLGAFAWVNQGANATVTDNGGTLFLDTVAADNAIALRMLQMACPGAIGGTPYKVTLGFYPFMAPNTPSGNMGFFLRDSGTNKIITCSATCDAGGLSITKVDKWTNATTWSASYSPTKIIQLAPGAPIWMQVEDDGAIRNFRVSPDGTNYWTVFSAAKDYITTPTHMGFFVNDNLSNKQIAMSLFSWLEE